MYEPNICNFSELLKPLCCSNFIMQICLRNAPTWKAILCLLFIKWAFGKSYSWNSITSQYAFLKVGFLTKTFQKFHDICIIKSFLNKPYTQMKSNSARLSKINTENSMIIKTGTHYHYAERGFQIENSANSSIKGP